MMGGLSRALAVVAAAGMIGIGGCISSRDLRSHELIGGARPPIAPDAVQLYLEPPPRQYEQIAVLYSSSRRSWSFTSQSKADVVVRRLKEEAASLGANGVMLREITYQPGPAIDAVAGTNYMGPRGTVDLGVGVSTFTVRRYGRAIAIYLPP
jgi:hypothetical protein